MWEKAIASDQACELCLKPGGDILWEDERCRVIRVGGKEGADYPGFCRVIWCKHVREMSDLPAVDRNHLMALVYATESALRSLYRPEKINLASLGNLVPHLHWHVIPRFADDPQFPAPIWASKTGRPVPARSRPAIDNLSLCQAISQALATDRRGS
ncbi:MAG: HIT domain-containing protein [Sterolibacterium sp.]